MPKKDQEEVKLHQLTLEKIDKIDFSFITEYRDYFKSFYNQVNSEEEVYKNRTPSIVKIY